MDVKEFETYLDGHKDDFEYAKADYNGKSGIIVKNNRFETETHFAFDAIQKNNLELLLMMMAHGKNVEHVTRVTGFYSKVGSWNKGKRGELRDRYKSRIERTD